MFDLVVRFYQEQVREREGIRQFLEELTAGGVRMCIASATDEWMGKHAMERTGLDRYFDRYFCCREVGEGKETDRIYQTARAYLGTDVERTVIFEMRCTRPEPSAPPVLSWLVSGTPGSQGRRN